MGHERYQKFLDQSDHKGQTLTFLAGDCSHRTYYRVGALGSAILMDAPPPAERLDDFVYIGKILRDLGLSAPQVFTYDLRQGLALIEDFGHQTYSRCLADGEADHDLYTLATEVLIHLHKNFDVKTEGMVLAPYSLDEYMREVNLCLEWYYPAAYGHTLNPKGVRSWTELWGHFLAPLQKQETLVLRDFMVDNLVCLPHKTGVQRLGLLDFQDALLGPRAYDLVSLLEDARYDVPEHIQKSMIGLYLKAFPNLDADSFLSDYHILGLQRSVKILGIFVRMNKRYNRSSYLGHLPRVWRWIDQDLKHPSLEPMRLWFDQYMPAQERRVLNAY